MDHPLVFAFYETEKEGLTDDYKVYHGPDALANTYAQWKKEKTGFLSEFPFGAFAFAKLDEKLKDDPTWKAAQEKAAPGRDAMGLTKTQPNIEFWNSECYGGPKQYVDFPAENKHCFAIVMMLMNPQARGTATLKSKDPFENPIIDPNFMGHELDMFVMSEGCRFGNEIVMQGKGTSGIVKGFWRVDLTHHTHTSREDWVPFIRQNVTTCYHAAGTCKMGKADDSMAVLDEKLRVRGVAGLRVADVSVMPRLHGGHTQMPAYGIGEKAADMIKEANLKRVDSKTA